MASLHASISPRSLLSLSNPKKPTAKSPPVSSFSGQKPSRPLIFARNKQKIWALHSVVQGELDVIPVQSGDRTDQQEGVVVSGEAEREESDAVSQVSGFAASAGEGRLSFEGFSSASVAEDGGDRRIGNQKIEKMFDRIINATIVLAAGTFAITKLLTIDHNHWHGWTLFEILRYAPQHNWFAYEEALKTNPVLAKMVISGVVYSMGDWIAQCYEGKPLLEIDRTRMLRSGLVGFALHGSLSHYYYQYCEEVFPVSNWWVVPVKVAIDQTFWAAVWNCIYFTLLGFLRLESPVSVFKELKATFWPMLTAGWKLWPFAHLVTYGLIPVEQRLLWVDCVELIWVTILSTYSNEKSEARISDAPIEQTSTTSMDPSKE